MNFTMTKDLLAIPRPFFTVDNVVNGNEESIECIRFYGQD